MEIKLHKYTGSFAENKDVAKDIRIHQIIPSLEEGKKVIINFNKINSATQSFIHALISDIIRKKGVNVLKEIYFKNCNLKVQKMIEIVTEYMQDSF